MDGFPGLLVRVFTYGGTAAGVIYAVVWLIQNGLLSFNLNVGKPKDEPMTPPDPRPKIEAAPQLPSPDAKDANGQPSSARPGKRAKAGRKPGGQR